MMSSSSSSSSSSLSLTEIAEEFPRVVGQCVCALSRCASLKTMIPTDDSSEVSCSVVCRLCDDEEGESDGDSGAQQDGSCSRDLTWMEPFFAILHVTGATAGATSSSSTITTFSAATRRAFLHALYRVIRHVQDEQQFRRFVDGAMMALADPDYGVRMTLAHLVPEFTRNSRLLKSILKANGDGSSR